MKRKAWSFVFLILAGAVIFADGALFPYADVPVSAENPMEMTYHDVSVEIENGIARIRVEEEFRNASDSEAEVVYIFPVPKGSTISGFEMTVGDRKVAGEILDAESAGRFYRDYVTRRKDPALLEFVGNDMIRLSMYPFAPGEMRKVSLEYTQELESGDGYTKLVYPLKIDSLMNGPIKKAKIGGTVKTREKLYQIYSPTHLLETEISEDGFEGNFLFEDGDYIPADDFVILFETGRREFESYLVLNTETDDRGTFMIDLLPSVGLHETVPKTVIMVLDRSGSMDGKKFAQAVEAAKFVLSNLNPSDSFNLLLFNDTVAVFSDKNDGKPVPASEAGRASEWLDGIGANGGTNMYLALDTALGRIMKGAETDGKYLLFLTDGLPTVGVTDEAKIVSDSAKLAKNAGNVHLFVFGVGYDVNTYVLDLLSEKTDGLSFYVTENENARRTVSDLYLKISSPVLTEVRLGIEGDGISFFDLIPVPSIVYADSPLRVFGRFSGYGEAELTVRGAMRRGDFTAVYAHLLEPSYNPYVSLLWAGRRIKWLINEIRLNGNPELEKEVVELSKRYGIPTPYTAYLAQEPKGSLPYLSMPSSSHGQAAVQGSKQMNLVSQSQNLQQMQQAYQSVQGTDVRIVGGKIFRYGAKPGFWTDDDFEEEDVVKVKAFGSEYFELVGAHPEILEYLKIAGRVRFNFEGTNYSVE